MRVLSNVRDFWAPIEGGRRLWVLGLIFGAAACAADGGSSPANSDFLSADPGLTAAQAGNYARDNEAPATGSEGDPTQGGGATREIVEADLYKIDGTTLFLLNRYRGLVAVDIADPTALRVVGRLPFRGEGKEMYVQDGRAYILLQSYSAWNFDSRNAGSGLLAVDVSAPARMATIRFFPTPGQIVDSRQVGQVIYMVSTGWYYDDGRAYAPAPDCSTMDLNGSGSAGDAPVSTSGTRFRLASINIANPAAPREVAAVVLGGSGQAVTVSQTHVFVADPDWGRGDGRQQPKVRVFDISDPAGAIVERGSIDTVGYVADRFKMEHRAGHLFVISQVWESGASGARAPGVYLESFGLDAASFGAKKDELFLKANEQAFATRYDGGRLYVVTYQRVDPLFVIDIANPAELRVMGELVIPGWSTHIEPRGDALLAVGRDDSATGRGDRVKISLFDVSDATRPTERATVVIGEPGEYSYSVANNDWKAFKIWDELGLIALPVDIWSPQGGESGSRLFIIDFTATSLTRRGSVLSRGSVLRGVAHQGRLFALGDQEVQAIDMANRDQPRVVSSVRLARYADNVVACGGKLCALGGADYDGALRLAQYDPADPDKLLWESQPLNSAPRGGYSWGTSRLRRFGTDRLGIVTLRYGDYDAEGRYTAATHLRVHMFRTPTTGTPTLEWAKDLPGSAIPAEIADLGVSGEQGWWYPAFDRADVAFTPSGALAITFQYYGYRYSPPDEDPTEIPGEGPSVDGESIPGDEVKPPDPTDADLIEATEIFNDGASTETPTQPRAADGYWQRTVFLVYDLRNPEQIPAPVAITDIAPAVAFDNQPWFDQGYGYADRPRLFPQDNTVWVPSCESATADTAGRRMVRCYAHGLDLSAPAGHARAARIAVPGILAKVSGNDWFSVTARWVAPASPESAPGLSGELCVLKREGDVVRVLASYPLQSTVSGGYSASGGGTVTPGVPSEGGGGDTATGSTPRVGGRATTAPQPYRMVRDHALFDDAAGAWILSEDRTEPVSVWVQSAQTTCVTGRYSNRQSLRYIGADGRAGNSVALGDESSWWQVQAVGGGGVVGLRSCGSPWVYGGWRGGVAMEDAVGAPTGGLGGTGSPVAEVGARSVMPDGCEDGIERWRYLGSSGEDAAGTLEAGTYFGYYYGGYGSVAGSFAVQRLDRSLYFARGWDGLVPAELP